MLPVPSLRPRGKRLSEWVSIGRNCGGIKFPEQRVTKMYSLTLLAIRGGGLVSNVQKKL